MKSVFYPKLAWDGIRKNKQLYVPYILTCIGMVMMYYIIYFLANASAVENIPGSSVIQQMLRMGCSVLAVFSVLFLFYSNAFLMRRRKREFGLYNILGMGKGNISRILLWETLLVAGIALLSGMGLGIALSKLFELLLVNMMEGQVRLDFTISMAGVKSTLLIFGGIFVLLFLNALRQISLSKPVELLRSESAGEKPPKANWLAGLLGLAILAAAYYIAVTIQDPVTTLVAFFVAVIMVICATYLLLIFGSVVLCRMLQKNKRYYYKPNHFVSVSSMTYRMKRNGAGLASICILLTMVLVMISSTTALFVGTEDSIHIRYPKDMNMEVKLNGLQETEETDQTRADVQTILDRHLAVPENVYDYRTVATSGFLQEGVLYNNPEALGGFRENADSEVVLTFFVPLSDYNRLMGQEQTLDEGEALIYPFRTEYTGNTFQVSGGEVYQVKEVVNSFVDNGNSAMTIYPTIFVFVPDLEAAAASLEALGGSPDNGILQYYWYYAFDLDLPVAEQIEIYHEMRDADVPASGNLECREVERADFYGLYGGLFFLGIMLSIVFLAAAVLIIYYKQISEGYEDQARFEIMQKVGMTKREIRKTINSQVLTVFFLPLAMAGIHLCFAFPMVRKMLLIFNLWDTKLLVLTTAACFMIFGVLYAIVYRLTSNRYYAIVSGGKE